MNCQQIFTLAQASEMLPKLKAMLSLAKEELSEQACQLKEAVAEYERCEQDLAQMKPANSTDAIAIDHLRACRQQFEQAIQSVTACQQNYNDCLKTWLERFSETGVLLRDLNSGLLDFPARQGKFEYFLCWHLGEDEIGYWHMCSDGFVGRRPLSVLSEYM